MDEPSDHLLRTFGAIPPSSRVLDLGCGRGRHTEPLVRLGLDVHACDSSPEAVAAARSRIADVVGQEAANARCSVSAYEALGYADESFDWVVAFDSLSRAQTRAMLLEVLAEVRRVLKRGGWFYVAVPAVPDRQLGNGSQGYAGDSGLTPTFTARSLNELLAEADFAAAEPPSVTAHGRRRLVQAIYRKTDVETPA